MNILYDAKTKMIEKGVVGYGSQLGHYNFYYPDKKIEIQFVSDAIVRTMNWASQGGLVAVLVQSSFVKSEEKIYSKTHIVWVNPSVIKYY